MAKYSLSDFFSEQHACSRRDLEKATIAGVTGRDHYAVLAMFRAWHPSNFNHVSYKRLALSKPAPLKRGQINPNVTEKRKQIEGIAYGTWPYRTPVKLTDVDPPGVIIPPMPKPRDG